jgi:CRISPR-associated protein Cas5d
VERVSYEVITPSAARGIFSSIFWKPAFRWQITRIEVLNPIVYVNIKRNEVPASVNSKTKCVFIEDKRTQRNSMILKDLHYRLWAKLVYIPVGQRDWEKKSREVVVPEEEQLIRNSENPMKYYEMFKRRASKGQCVRQPYFGNAEWPVHFRLVDVENETLEPPINLTKNLGLYLYDIDYNSPNKRQILYRPVMKNGVIEVPEIQIN